MRLVEWQGCASPCFGITDKTVGEDKNICDQCPIGLSSNGIANYHVKGTFSVQRNVIYLVEVDRVKEIITIKSVEGNNSFDVSAPLNPASEYTPVF